MGMLNRLDVRRDSSVIREPMTLAGLLALVHERGGSDLHLAAGMPPLMRLHGRLLPLPRPRLDAHEAARLCRESIAPQQEHLLNEMHELDFAFDGGDGLRCRGNLFHTQGCIAGVFRLIAADARSAAELGLPSAVEKLADLPSGLVLVTGATGSGKSTTLAALIEKINRQRQAHIITIEDPIELIYTPRSSLIRQREIGRDTSSFGNALRFILRQDPDIVLIGEIRDRETAAAALLIADTGHLVLSTLHGNSAVETLHRMLSLFAAEQQAQARHQLSAVLQGVVCQQLVPRRDAGGQVAAFEVLIANAAVRNLLREEKLHQIYSQLQVGRAAFGMQTMAQSLAELCVRGIISEADALAHAPLSDDVRGLLGQRRSPLAGEPHRAEEGGRR
jgi:twitching motility protein PilT